VTQVSVSSESGGEVATYCGSPKRSEFYCPDEGPVPMVEDGTPLGVYVRVVFDELLDPSIEVLDETAGTGSIVAANPITINCGGAALSYEGFYDPAGSHLTDPPGPALVVEPTARIASGSSCTVSVNAVVTDKSGNQVPGDQAGPHAFALAPLNVLGSEPADGAEGVGGEEIVVIFNNAIDEGSLAGRVHLTQDGNDVPFAAGVLVLEDDPDAEANVLIVPSNPLPPSGTFTVTLDAGIADVAGGTFQPEGGSESFTFTTGQ
jgi:hypothetical protein